MLETITALLASTTFMIGAWVVIAILMAILLEFEKEGWATTFFSLGIALLLWNFRGDIWTFISSNPTATIGFAVSYVVVGVVWSFLKWNSYVKNVFGKLKKIKDEFIRDHKEINDKNRSSFNNKIDRSGIRKGDGDNLYLSGSETLEEIIEKISPIASEKKSIITSWISYWPVSLMATLLNNPFRKFFEWVYDNLSGYYDKITTSQKQTLLD
jgi:hypothetical protein